MIEKYPNTVIFSLFKLHTVFLLLNEKIRRHTVFDFLMSKKKKRIEDIKKNYFFA